MDCQGFDDVVMDLVYDDGPSSQAQDEARAHAEGCSRCAALLASYRGTRGVIALPLPPAPAGLERRILDEVERRRSEREASWWRRLDQAISLLASYAMRPQAAMSAVLMLSLGMSLLLLRARPAGPGAVRITENGIPAEPPAAAAAAPQATAAAAASVAMPERKSEAELPKRDDRGRGDVAPTTGRPAELSAAEPAPAAAPPPPAPAAPAPVATATALPTTTASPADATPQEAAYATAMDHYKARRYAEAVRAFDVVANGGGGNAALAALYAARATRYSGGCGAALPRYDAVASRHVGSGVAAEATWEAAVCYREVGQADRARQLFSSLRRVAGYRDRAERELDALDGGKPDTKGQAKPGGQRK